MYRKLGYKEIGIVPTTFNGITGVDLVLLEKNLSGGNGLPFRPSIPTPRPTALGEMTKEEFDAKMERSLAQAKAGEGMAADEFFELLKQE